MDSPYTGTDNLEAMEAAVNYNKYLVSLILGANESRSLSLDFGAGVGTFARTLHQEGIAVECVEPDEKQAAVIERGGLRVYRNLSGIQDEQYPFVYSLNVLEHIQDDRAALRQLHRVLARGGKLLIYVPAFQVLYSAMDRKVGHVRRYTRGELVAKATEAGFKIERSYYADSLGFVASLVFKLLGNTNGDLNRRSVYIYDRFLFPFSQALDVPLRRWLGKNVVLVARKQ